MPRRGKAKNAPDIEDFRSFLFNKELTPEDVTDLWINGHYFHNNIEKRRFLKSVEPHLLDGAKAIFFDHVIETTRVIKHLGENIDVALRQGWLKT